MQDKTITSYKRYSLKKWIDDTDMTRSNRYDRWLETNRFETKLSDKKVMRGVMNMCDA